MEQFHQITFEEAINEIKKKRLEKPKDLLDILLDKDNRDPIVLMDENGKQISFEQVAIAPMHDVKLLYVVLKPIDRIDGVADDEAVVFLVTPDKNGNTILRVEEDEEICIAVFNVYYDMLEAARKNKHKNTGN